MLYYDDENLFIENDNKNLSFIKLDPETCQIVKNLLGSKAYQYRIRAKTVMRMNKDYFIC
jgi:hypothetical protein